MTRVLVLGGGAAGFFGAIRAAELGSEVTLLEAATEPLQKVRISGGGRCNVTHALFDAARFVEHYPRGAKELRAALARFGPADTVRWFEERGVALKTEEDRRMFPTTDDSETIVSCLLAAARDADVEVRTRAHTEALERDGPAWRARLRGGETYEADRVLLATGSSPTGLRLAASAGHAVVPPVPALFSLVVRDPRIEGLAGVAVPHARATLAVEGLKRPVTKEGPVLVTHQGVSAPAILRISSWAARELAEAKYRATLTLDLAPELTEEELRRRAEARRAEHPRGTVAAHGLADAVPRRLWDRLLAAAGVAPETRWAEMPKAALNKAIAELKRGVYATSGRGDFREEIATAGGVARKEVDWTRMESRVAPGLHLAGEVLDVDGLTGGFNLQNAWTTGWIAGSAMGATDARGAPSS